MLNTSHMKHLVEAALGQLAALLPGFRVRESQQQMMMTIVDVLANGRFEDDSRECSGDHIGVIEAPTGTGKSIGAILPAVIVARELKKSVVVSSATVALQEQLLKKDLPLIQKALGGELTYAIAKGRGRYACVARAALHGSADGLQTDLLGDTGSLTFKPTDEESAALAKLSQDLLNRQWNGDRDDLPDAVSDRAWYAMTIDRNACTGRNCRYVRQCPYVLAREAMQKADLIIANHDLVLADLKLGGGILLPKLHDTIHIIDEAHNLPAKAVSAFSSSHTLIGMQRMLSRVPRAVSRAATIVTGQTLPLQRMEHCCEVIAASFDELMGAFDQHPGLQSRTQNSRNLPSVRFAHGVLPDHVREVARTIHEKAKTLYTDICLSKAYVDAQLAASPDDTLAALASEIGLLVTKIDGLEETWRQMLYEARDRQVPVAKWIGLEPMGRGYDYTVNTASISAAEYLAAMLWRRASAAILTSATLTAAGEFRMILRRSGLFRFPDVTTLKLESPFDYKKNARLVIPVMVADPKAADAHTREIINLLPQIVQDNGEGTLVLFSSRRQMEDVYKALPANLQKLILMQGQKLSKSEILAKHCRRIERNKTSVIFGLDSYSEGVDLAGRLCSHVVIAKIPFSAPVDPVEEATAEWVKKMGGDPFNDLAVPAACIKIVQSAGRLLRTETDTGTVTILDKRLTTQRYGQAILDSLPPFRREVLRGTDHA